MNNSRIKKIYSNKMNTELSLKVNEIELDSFYNLRELNDFVHYSKEDLKKGLEKSVFVLQLYLKNECIAAGRVVGDGYIAFLLKDIMVHPDYKRKGLGSIIVEEILSLIYEDCSNFAYIALMSTVGKEPFYKKFGFIERPNEVLGSGMIKYYVKK